MEATTKIRREWNFWRNDEERPLFAAQDEDAKREAFLDRVFPERTHKASAKAPGVYSVRGGQMQKVRGGVIYKGEPRDDLPAEFGAKL